MAGCSLDDHALQLGHRALPGMKIGVHRLDLVHDGGRVLGDEEAIGPFLELVGDALAAIPSSCCHIEIMIVMHP